MKFPFLPLIAIALFATACNPITGQLKVASRFTAIVEERRHDCTGEEWPNCNGDVTKKKITVAPGAYRAELEFADSHSAQLSIKLANGDSRDLQLRIPNNNNMPSYSGPVSLGHAESGQPFDIRGTINTTERDSARQSGWETCTYTSYEQWCDYRGCYTRPVTVTGQRWVEFHDHFTDTTLAVELFPVGTSGAAASFQGERHLADRVVDSASMCH